MTLLTVLCEVFRMILIGKAKKNMKKMFVLFTSSGLNLLSNWNFAFQKKSRLKCKTTAQQFWNPLPLRCDIWCHFSVPPPRPPKSVTYYLNGPKVSHRNSSGFVLFENDSFNNVITWTFIHYRSLSFHFYKYFFLLTSKCFVF